MKQQHTLKYFIKSLAALLLFCVSGHAQNDSIVRSVNDSLKIETKYGLRLGADISKLVRTFLEDDYTVFEIVADYRLTKRLFIAGELGTEEKTTSNDYLNATVKGNYFKAGVDFNLYRNWLDMENMIYGGLRLGASTFSQTLNSFTVFSTDQYWEPQFSSDASQEFSGLTALWIELVFGLKVEVINNLYLGVNVQLKGLISQTQPENFENLHIPGFNKTYDSGEIGAGFGYGIMYSIPIFKKDK
jgi:hypothetical protein